MCVQNDRKEKCQQIPLTKYSQQAAVVPKPFLVKDSPAEAWSFLSLWLYPGIMFMACVLHAEITGRPLSGEHLHLLTQLARPTTGTKQTRKQCRKTTQWLSYH